MQTWLQHSMLGHIGDLLKAQSNLRGKELHRTNQSFNFLWGSYITVPVQFGRRKTQSQHVKRFSLKELRNSISCDICMWSLFCLSKIITGLYKSVFCSFVFLSFLPALCFEFNVIFINLIACMIPCIGTTCYMILFSHWFVNT